MHLRADRRQRHRPRGHCFLQSTTYQSVFRTPSENNFDRLERTTLLPHRGETGFVNGWCYREDIFGELVIVNKVPLPAYRGEYERTEWQTNAWQSWNFGY